MKKQEILDKIINLVKIENQNDGLSTLLTRCHNLITHSAPVAEWDETTQYDLYTLWQVIEAVKEVETEVKNGNIE
jgi:hypothetical protein